MDLQSVYDSFGGDYEAVLSRLISADRIEKYLKLFLADTLMQDLNTTYQAGDYESMFRASHTMKGNSDTLGLSKLHDSSVELTEALRAKDYSNLDALLATVQADYDQIESAVAGA